MPAVDQAEDVELAAMTAVAELAAVDQAEDVELAATPRPPEPRGSAL
jgi:hypothetical protein